VVEKAVVSAAAAVDRIRFHGYYMARLLLLLLPGIWYVQWEKEGRTGGGREGRT
jgi:hypothetical protein